MDARRAYADDDDDVNGEVIVDLLDDRSCWSAVRRMGASILTVSTRANT